jgi:hypothetical protein
LLKGFPSYSQLDSEIEALRQFFRLIELGTGLPADLRRFFRLIEHSMGLPADLRRFFRLIEPDKGLPTELVRIAQLNAKSNIFTRPPLQASKIGRQIDWMTSCLPNSMISDYRRGELDTCSIHHLEKFINASGLR